MTHTLDTASRAGTASASAAQDEEHIRALAAAWSKALEEKDVGGLTAEYAPDVLLFDVKPPFRTDGVDAIRRLWEECLPCFPARFKAELRDFKVTVGGDVAFSRCLRRIRPIGEESPAGDTWLRVTSCYQRIGGRWRVVHEHVSVPFDPVIRQVSYITNPGGDE